MPERYSSRISCIRCCTRCSISLRPEPMVSFRDTVATIDRMADSATSRIVRSEEHTSELQSLMRISYAVFCLKKKNGDKDVADMQRKREIMQAVTAICET